MSSLNIWFVLSKRGPKIEGDVLLRVRILVFFVQNRVRFTLLRQYRNLGQVFPSTPNPSPHLVCTDKPAYTEDIVSNRQQLKSQIFPPYLQTKVPFLSKHRHLKVAKIMGPFPLPNICIKWTLVMRFFLVKMKFKMKFKISSGQFDISDTNCRANKKPVGFTIGLCCHGNIKATRVPKLIMKILGKD